MKHNKR